ncbi:MAG: histidine phosphatase family protein [Deltaproteobacteria bacterium]|nr:histidine phosphatase family protein [Deltaproteobacteria bacterium]
MGGPLEWSVEAARAISVLVEVRLRWGLIRHGQTLANRDGRLQGRGDAPLSPLGRAQAQALRRLMMGWTGLCACSPAPRAAATARIAGLEPLTVPALVERSLGAWEGRSGASLRAAGEMVALLSWEGRAPGGESQREVALRAVGWCAGIHGQDVLVISHAGVLRVLLGLLDGVPSDDIGVIKVPHGEVMWREVGESRWATLLAQLR